MANLSKTILESLGGWQPSIVGNQEMYKRLVDKMFVDMADQKEERSVGHLGKRRAPAAWASSNSKRQQGKAAAFDQPSNLGWAGGAASSRGYRGGYKGRCHY